MSQHDYVISDANGLAFLSDVNQALPALASNNSGATEPAATYAYMWWSDTATGILKQRNAANSAWIPILTLATGLPVGAALVDGAVNNFRLSLTTALPVTTTDVTGATTIYAVPYTGKYIDLFDGTNWNRRSSSQFSLALDALTSGLPYDVFCYDNAGVPTLEFTAWTNTTTRATGLVYQDGVLSKSGALTRRYLGSFYTTSTTATEDSASKRYLFNYYHRKRRFLSRKETTGGWIYTTATWRQANGSTSNQVNFFVGVVEDEITATASVGVSTSASQRVSMALGLNSITAPSGLYASAIANGVEAQLNANLEVMPALGLNYLAWLEWSQASGTTTWYGFANEVNQQLQSGLQAWVMA